MTWGHKKRDYKANQCKPDYTYAVWIIRHQADHYVSYFTQKQGHHDAMKKDKAVLVL